MSTLSCELKGLNCANCAAKIQKSISELNGVMSAEIIFATQRLNMEIADANAEKYIIDTVKKVVNKFEPDVEVIELNLHVQNPLTSFESSSLKKDLFILGLGVVPFITGLLFSFPFWLEVILFGLSYIIVGGDVVKKAIGNILRGQVFDENFLMSIATLGAFAIRQFPEATSVMLFYKAGQLMQDMSVNKSRRSIKALLDIRPDYANLQTHDGLIKINPNDVSIGSIIIIKPGEKVPLDGKVINGSSTLDTSVLTGESTPRVIRQGDDILSGFINITGTLSVEVMKNYSQSTVSKILDLVQNAASKKAPTENFITKFARYYTPAVVAAAICIALLPPVINGSMAFSNWIYRALVFLVISCPCALVISIPLSFFGGIGSASKKGILVKGSNYLEALNRINTVVFDKTGTLTKGVFKVSEVVPSNGYSNKDILEMAALAEAHSNHPIAKSIIEAFGSDLETAKIDSYQEIPGHGIRAVINGKEILAGNDKLLHVDGCIEHDTCSVQGTVVHVAVDNIYAGYILISDQVKNDSAKTVSELRKLGEIRVAMLTGDSEQSARSIAKELKIDEFYFGLLPHQKVEKLEYIKNSSLNSKLVFVGDGINDAPVLAMADIGVAMGGLGSDAAIEAADIVLMTDEPSKLVDAVKIAKTTRSIVWQNIIFSLGVKILVLTLGAGGLATMWEAVFADVGVTLLAVFNSLRVMKD